MCFQTLVRKSVIVIAMVVFGSRSRADDSGIELKVFPIGGLLGTSTALVVTIVNRGRGDLFIESRSNRFAFFIPDPKLGWVREVAVSVGSGPPSTAERPIRLPPGSEVSQRLPLLGEFQKITSGRVSGIVEIQLPDGAGQPIRQRVSFEILGPNAETGQKVQFLADVLKLYEEQCVGKGPGRSKVFAQIPHERYRDCVAACRLAVRDVVLHTPWDECLPLLEKMLADEPRGRLELLTRLVEISPTVYPNDKLHELLNRSAGPDRFAIVQAWNLNEKTRPVPPDLLAEWSASKDPYIVAGLIAGRSNRLESAELRGLFRRFGDQSARRRLEDIRELVAGLNDNQFRRRQAARAELIRIGDPVINALKELPREYMTEEVLAGTKAILERLQGKDADDEHSEMLSRIIHYARGETFPYGLALVRAFALLPTEFTLCRRSSRDLPQLILGMGERGQGLQKDP